MAAWNSWRDDLGKITLADGTELVAGCFRGVPFRTVAAEIKVGRRNVVNEYPQRDTAYVDDLGRRARRFVVEAYVIGDFYFDERDALIEALETAGPGELIHPRYGSRRVSVEGDVAIRETPEHGGMARLTMTFVEDGLNTFPQAEENTVAQLEAASNAADDASQACFAADFSVAGPGLLSSQALDGLKGLTATVTGMLALARRVTSLAGLAAIVGLVGQLTSSLAQLIRLPVVLVQSLRSIYAQLVQELMQPLAAFAELQAVFASNARSPAVAVAVAMSGSTLARSLANDTARADLQRRLALSNQARILAVAISNLSSTPDVVATSGQARALRDALLAQIDTELEVNDPPAALAQALSRLRAAVVRDVAARAEFLLKTSSYTPQTVLPALLLAHRIYGDATRADELVARNGVAHPAFMPARALEVLL